MKAVKALRFASVGVPFLASTFFVIAQPVWLITDGEVLAASSVLFSWGLGQLLGSFLLAGLLRRWAGQRFVGKIASSIVVLMAALSVMVSLVGANTTWLLPISFVGGACWSAFQVTVRTIYGSWGELWARRGSAFGRVGAAAGSALYPIIVITTDSLWVGSFLVLGVFLSPIFTQTQGEYQRSEESEGEEKSDGRFVLTDNLVLVWGSYGLIAVHVVIISLAASVEWVSTFTPLLALGALIAPTLALVVPSILKRDLSGWLVLTLLANLSWFLLLIHPGFVLLVALLSGLMFFVVEGSADWDSYQRNKVSELVLGRSIGANISGATMLAMVAVFQNEPFALVTVYIGLGVLVTLVYLGIRHLLRLRAVST